MTNSGAVLRYACVEPNGKANLHLKSLGVRFLFRPNWTSASGGGTNAPTGDAHLLTVGDYAANPAAGSLEFFITSNGDRLSVRSSDGTTTRQAISLVLSNYSPTDGPFRKDKWHELLFGLSHDRIAIWKDETFLTNLLTSMAFAPAALRTNGFTLGGRPGGTSLCMGTIDELEIFDYPLQSPTMFESSNTAYAEAIASPPAIRLHWRHRLNSHTNFQIERRLHGSTTGWTNGWTILTTHSDGFKYTDVLASTNVGKRFDYRVRGKTPTFVEDKPLLPGLVAGLEAPPVLKRGRVLLLVDNTLSSSLAGELTQFTSDLVGDGWRVIRTNVPRHDDVNWSLNTNNIQNLIKPGIVSHYNAYTNAVDGERLKALVLIGHVAVPYTGMDAEDGHVGQMGTNDNHYGAWSSDLYYADMDGTWSDTSNYDLPGNPPLAPRYPITTNYFNDGKFDDRFVPGNSNGIRRLEISVGRIDFANQPAFANPPTSLDEVGLLKRYFDKNHRFRHGMIRTSPRGLVYNSWTQSDSPSHNYQGLGNRAQASLSRLFTAGPSPKTSALVTLLYRDGRKP